MGTETASNERRTLVATGPGRADTLLAEAFPDLTRARVQRRIDAGDVTLNGTVVKKSARVSAGDELAILVDMTPAQAGVPDFELTVIYEDDAILAIDKPAGLAVHGAPGDEAPTVAGWFAARCGGELRGFESDHPGIVHRLDKDTTGVLVLAKTPQAQAALSRAFEQRTSHKTYLAICDGKPARDKAVIEAAIARHPADRTKMGIVKHGRPSRTNYEVLGAERDHSIVLVRPETGRTHQIRVHLAAIGAPVTHDAVYGKAGAGRQLLHAWRLEVPHPNGGTVAFVAPLPPDFVAFLGECGLEAVASEYVVPRPPLRTP